MRERIRAGDLARLKFPIKILDVSYDIGSACIVVDDSDHGDDQLKIFINGIYCYISVNFIEKIKGEK